MGLTISPAILFLLGVVYALVSLFFLAETLGGGIAFFVVLVFYFIFIYGIFLIFLLAVALYRAANHVSRVSLNGLSIIFVLITQGLLSSVHFNQVTLQYGDLLVPFILLYSLSLIIFLFSIKASA